MESVILAADDDEDAHLLLRRAFSRAGINAVLKHVNDGAEAIAYLEGRGPYADRSSYPLPSLLLLDLKMPNLSGLGVLEHLQKNGRPPGLRVVVFSSSDNASEIERATALGSDGNLLKPCGFQGLLEVVQLIERDFLHPDAVRKTATGLVAPASAPPAPVSKADARTESQRLAANPSLNPAASPEMFQLLVDQVKDYAIFLLDNEGFVRSWNEGARRIKGYEANEIIGRHFSTFYPSGDRDSEKPQFELRMAREMGRYEEEGWRVRKDGSRFWANVIVTPLRDKQGRQSGFAKVTRDLTQRKMQEDHLQRLLESEERFRLLVDQVKDYAIFFLDSKGNISSWNQGARRIKGYTADEIIGRHFSIFYTPPDLAIEKPARALTIAVQHGRYEEEGWRLKKDGSRFWASVVITALWDKRGNLSGFAKVTRDLTQRKAEEDALRARTLELEAFAHTLSHDLRGPVRSIASFAQLLKADASDLDEAERKSCLDKICRSAQSIETLIRDILKLSQVSLAPAASEDVPLAEVVEEARAALDAEIRERKAEIHVRGPLPVIQANRTLLFQIVSNLLGNGLKFVRVGEVPRVEIFSVYGDADCDIHFRDNGVGIPPGLRQSIFEMFNRGSAGNESSGSGIGLAIVKKSVDRVGGSISVVSEEGQGSDFVVRLPCEVLADKRSLETNPA